MTNEQIARVLAHALEGARLAFGHHKASDSAAEAMCSFIEERLREHGIAVGVRFDFIRDPLTPNATPELRFRVILRDHDATYTLVVLV